MLVRRSRSCVQGARQLDCVRRVFFISDAGTGEGMGSETIVGVSGLIGLGAAVLTGALWDSPLVSALLRLRENLRSQGRHAMPR